MSKILIENYRGFDVEFDTDYEKFQCVITEETSKESVSFKSIKKFIDDYKKENQSFNPFKIVSHPNKYSNEIFTVIGRRKDGKFIIQDEQGETKQLSSWNEDDYMLFNSKNEEILDTIKKERDYIKLKMKESTERTNQLISRLDIVTVKDFKNSL
jgi:hypothetical protein